jgi:Uma2 family endonuclease
MGLMRTAERLLSIDEYLDRHFEPETELIAGELRPKPLGTDHHSDICVWLYALLMQQVGRTRTRVELSIRVGDDVLIPDVCVLHAKEKALYRDILAEPPLLCVEVISPSQRSAEMLAKCERYHEFGVPFCWVIDPVTRRAWESHAGQAAAEPDAALTAGDLSVSLTELFSAD